MDFKLIRMHFKTKQNKESEKNPIYCDFQLLI